MKKNDEIYLTKKQFYLGLIGFIFSVIFSIYSIYISSEANFFAREANNMSLMTLSHQRIIEEADLQIGTPQSANFYVDGKYLNESSIRISLVNGYYARYPTLIVSIQGILNGKKIDLKDVPIIETKAIQNPKNFRFIDKDKPTYIEIVFANYPYFNISEDDTLYTIKRVTSKENLNEGKNFLELEIHYTDFSKMITWTINPNIEFTISDGKINPESVNLVNIEKREIKRINQS